ncbi:MAG: dihydropteroate synthase [Thermoplasmata archaeon]
MPSSPSWNDVFFRFNPASVSKEYGIPIDNLADHSLFIISKERIDWESEYFMTKGRYVYPSSVSDVNRLITAISYPPGESFWIRPTNTFFESHLKGIEPPVVMAIINMTPDSFYPESRIEDGKLAETLTRIKEKGVKLVDIGGQSTRPGSERITAEEEMRRIRKAVEISLNMGFFVSIDSFYPEVVRECLEMGSHVINDVTGMENQEIGLLSKRYGVPLIIMHKKGDFKTMQVAPYYENVIEEIISFFLHRIEDAKNLGIDDNVIFDPGIGFGKRVVDNLTIIRNLRDLKLGHPLLIGLSRKGFIGTLTGESVEERGLSTLIFHTIALMQGVDIIRVHDVEESVKLVNIMKKMNEY